MIQAGNFSPETGAHYINISGAVGPFNPAVPGSYIYDGTSPTSRLIGLMYLSSGEVAPEGFAGPNDHWHRHFNTCVIYGAKGIEVPFPADSDVKKSQCDAVHGTFMQRTTWMVHAWVVPGWESPVGRVRPRQLQRPLPRRHRQGRRRRLLPRDLIGLALHDGANDVRVFVVRGHSLALISLR